MNEILTLFKNMVLYGLEKFGLFYSVYRGYVYDNNDPKSFSRLQLNVPEVFGENVLDYWAWPASNFSGNGYGSQCIPQKNDMVWVKFEKGNPRKPLWLYGYFGSGEKPDNLKDIKNFWFKTPGGHIVELNDSDGSIKITSKDGHIIKMDSTGINITNADSKPISIGGDKQVLYATIPDSTSIVNVSQIGVSQTIKVGS